MDIIQLRSGKGCTSCKGSMLVKLFKCIELFQACEGAKARWSTAGKVIQVNKQGFKLVVVAYCHR
jgi:hypothetical protein